MPNLSLLTSIQILKVNIYFCVLLTNTEIYSTKKYSTENYTTKNIVSKIQYRKIQYRKHSTKKYSTEKIRTDARVKFRVRKTSSLGGVYCRNLHGGNTEVLQNIRKNSP